MIAGPRAERPINEFEALLIKPLRLKACNSNVADVALNLS
ncbi:hypothetical protein PCAR4_1300003 [Paraburkholderia caribensis]|nr:hypothetical protein PCAR4_1300003 [Paraburkholderia caribensis]